MARLNIPVRYRDGVAQIRKLDDESVRQIRAAFDGAFTGRNMDEVATTTPNDAAMTAITALPARDLIDFKPIGQALAALYSVKSQRDTTVEEFVEDICDAAEDFDSEELRLPHSERDQFRDKLLTLLNADLFALAAKAYDLKTDDERIFCHARILTDLRPVFGQKIADGPKAMLVMHLLKIGYHQGNDKHQEIIISLDSDDLASLRKTIDRAEAKAQSLGSTVRKDLPVFGIPNPDYSHL
ncbi:MAG: hypothetical protein LAP21_28755 [Acidobacteriia bacterium]|nr:hypothetical protein [Terriglobia bacterium]